MRYKETRKKANKYKDLLNMDRYAKPLHCKMMQGLLCMSEWMDYWLSVTISFNVCLCKVGMVILSERFIILSRDIRIEAVQGNLNHNQEKERRYENTQNNYVDWFRRNDLWTH